VTLLLTSHETPIGILNIIVDEDIVLGINLSNIAALKASLDSEDQLREIKSVKAIPKITELLNDYFDGDISAINAIKVRQPGAHFSQAAWKAMRKVSAGVELSLRRNRCRIRTHAGSCARLRVVGIDICNLVVIRLRNS